MPETPPGPIDPMTVMDEDFARHRHESEWRDLGVRRIGFHEGMVTWHVWRIANLAKPGGPLWVVPHDNEDAAFDAALSSVRAWGGVAMLVDTGAGSSGYRSRFNDDTGGAPPIDPNRNFRDTLPVYAVRMLADLRVPPRLIVAVHTNEPGFAAGLPGCGGQAGQGAGDISILLCNERFHPSAAQRRRWPFDDDDSLALVPYLAGRDPASAWCGRRLAAADYNVVFERVARSDGSLSNYAVQHGLRYINVETEERGSSPTAIVESRDRLVNMIDGVMERCGDVPEIALRL